MDLDWNGLLDACRLNDAFAREQLFKALRVRLVTITQYRLRGVSKEVIEDLVQNTLTLVIERITAIDSNPQLYALQILRNKIGDHLRGRARRTDQSLSPTGYDAGDEPGEIQDTTLADPESVAFETHVESAEIVQTIRRAIRKLTPICQALFAALLEQRSINEVWELAQETEPGLNRSAFDKRLFDCRKRLRVLIGNAL
jgi:RNA polymerase sigma factor (sigma-70 family)